MSTEYQALAEALNAFADTLNQIAAAYAQLLSDIPTMRALRQQAEIAMKHAPRIDPGSPVAELAQQAKLAELETMPRPEAVTSWSPDGWNKRLN